MEEAVSFVVSVERIEANCQLVIRSLTSWQWDPMECEAFEDEREKF